MKAAASGFTSAATKLETSPYREEISILRRQNRRLRCLAVGSLSEWIQTRLWAERKRPHKPARQLSGHCLPASVITAPPHEWPTRITGPF
jgi:hypothetical protein